MSMRSFNDTIGYRTCDLPAYSACLIHVPGMNNSKLQTFLSDVTVTRIVHFVRHWRLECSDTQQPSTLITSNFKCKISLHPNSRVILVSYKHDTLHAGLQQAHTFQAAWGSGYIENALLHAISHYVTWYQTSKHALLLQLTPTCWSISDDLWYYPLSYLK
jgi:hypothetical protein